jgi:C4-dicarboxylate-specific signal transduction histidine kinase
MRSSHKFRLPFFIVGSSYLSGYVILDSASYVHPFGSFGITPWNPSTGLSLLLILMYGMKTVPLIFAAAFLASVIVRGLPVPIWLAAIEVLVVGGGYALTGWVLLYPSVRFDASLRSLRDLFILVVAGVVSSAIVASVYVALLTAGALLQPTEVVSAAMRYWVGDMIGIAIVVPFGLLALTRDQLIRRDWQTALQVLAIALALTIAVASTRNHELHLFYLLYLPITWIAVRSGLEGVSTALVLTQLGLFVALQFAPERTINMTDLQARMLILSITGLVAGALVTERQRAERELRQNQYAITRLSQLGSMGELAAAIAHEVNQPLSAAGTYSRVVAESLETESLKDASIVETARKAVAQIERAADVIKRLRALVRLGRSDMAPVSISRIVQESLDLVRPIFERANIEISVEVDRALPPVLADRIQIAQVLVNLLRNSAEAISDSGRNEGMVYVEAIRVSPQLLEIRVRDTGPGFPAEFARTAPSLFSSKKPQGLGVGLSLCRSIIEAHRGTLHIASNHKGATVSFTLHFAREQSYGRFDSSCSHR